MKKIKLISSILGATLFLSGTAVFAGGPPKGMKMPTPKADIYIVQKPATLPVTLKYPATVKAYNKVQVVARALGTLKEKYFTEGQKVNKGDLLYSIEDDVYLARVEAAKASLQMSKASLDNATRSWKRVKKLFSQKAISQEKRDNALSAYEQSLASVALSQAQLKQAKINLAYTKVKAPIGGITGLKQANIGDLVSYDPPSKLVQITQNDKVYIEFSAPMSDYKKIKNHIWNIKNNDTLKVNLEVNGKILEKVGIVDFIDVNTNNQTAIVKMRAVFDNKDGYLMPGQFVRVITNNIIQKNIITIPQKAVLQNPLGTIVFIEDHGHVGVRPVMVGNVSKDNFIVTGGALKVGDRVIVNNFFRLKPGAEVIADKIINKQGK
jgi:membrane fusion protein (multidrug efflux system)